MLFHSLRALTDEQLMARVSGKDDERAYDELYRRHARRLMGFFLRQLGHDEALASDFTQDTFMRVWASRSCYSGSPFRTWLYSIAYNLCKNHYRHLSYEQEYAQEVALTGQEGQDNDFDMKMDRRAFEEALQSELAKLPPTIHLLFSLRFEEELAMSQIAIILGIPEGTVKSRLHNLTLTLRKNLTAVKPL